jgi:transcriptional regulator with XRE-family HTH domain
MAKAQFKDQELLNSIVLGLKSARKELNITQEDFYNDTGIHISRIETGSVNITISTLKAILDYYEISLSSFFEKINQ